MTIITSSLLNQFPFLRHGFLPKRRKKTWLNFRAYQLTSQPPLSSFAAFARGQQTHGKRVAILNTTSLPRQIIPQTDALITRKKHLALLVHTADCALIFLFDSRRKIIGLVHSGLLGTAQKIAPLTVQKMEQHFHSQPKDIYAYLGPSIGPCCYYARTKEQEIFFLKKFSPYTHWRQGKLYLDLWQAIENDLLKTGILPEHLENSHLCTACHPLFSSHRRQGKKRKTTNISFLGLI